MPNASYILNNTDAVAMPEGTLSIQKYIGKTISLAKKASGENRKDSMTVSLTLPARPAAPKAAVFEVTQPSEIMEYITDYGVTWINGTGEEISVIESASVYIVRYLAGENQFRSNPYVIAINAIEPEQEPTPEIGIDYENELLTGFDPNEVYLINGEPQLFVVEDCPAMTPILAVNQTKTGAADGKITGVDSRMEYRADGGKWTDVQSAEITGLSDGEYTVRIKAAENSFAGDAVTVTVGPDTATVIFVDYNGSVLQAEQLEKGKMPEYNGNMPSRPHDDTYPMYSAAGARSLPKCRRMRFMKHTVMLLDSLDGMMPLCSINKVQLQ